MLVAHLIVVNAANVMIRLFASKTSFNLYSISMLCAYLLDLVKFII